MKIMAGIITYNPNIKKLEYNIKAIKKQVEGIVICDNGSKNCEDIFKQISNNKHIIFIKNKINLGVATALNIIVHKAEASATDWLLTLDQDSICPQNLIGTYKKYISYSNVAMITSQIIVQGGRVIQKQRRINEDYEFVKRCITSASLLNLSICKEIGYFDDKLFIDYVDHDYCERVILNGYKILKTNRIFIHHELGSTKPVMLTVKLHKLLHTKIIYHEHSPKRVYYIIRNVTYYLRKYRHSLTIREVLFEFYVLLHTSIKHLVYEKDKYKFIKAIIKGIYDGFHMNINKVKKLYQS